MTPEINPLSRHRQLIFLALLGVSALLALARFDSFQVGTYSDDAYYIVLAEGLASGQGYRLVNFPDAPFEQTFPPGWPLLLVPLTIVFPGNHGVLKGLSFALWIGALVLVYKLLSRRLCWPYLELCIALIALNPELIGASGQVMSEMGYLFFSFLALNLFDLWHDSEVKHNKGKVARALLLFAAAAIAVFVQSIRTVGFSLVAGVFIYLLASRRYLQTLVVTLVAVLGLVPQLWLNIQRGGFFVSSGYETQVLSGGLSTKLLHMLMNLHAYVTSIVGHSLVPILGPTTTAIFERLGVGIIPPLIGFSIVLLIIVGFVSQLRPPRFVEWYIGLYVPGMLAFWNPLVGSAQARFLIPIIPFLYYYGIQGILSLGQAVALCFRVERHESYCARVRWIASVGVCDVSDPYCP